MRTMVLLVALLSCSLANAAIDFVTVKECRSWVFGKSDDERAQREINNKIKDELNKVKPKSVLKFQYGNEESFFRSKDNSCIIVTIWYEKQ